MLVWHDRFANMSSMFDPFSSLSLAAAMPQDPDSAAPGTPAPANDAAADLITEPAESGDAPAPAPAPAAAAADDGTVSTISAAEDDDIPISFECGHGGQPGFEYKLGVPVGGSAVGSAPLREAAEACRADAGCGCYVTKMGEADAEFFAASDCMEFEVDGWNGAFVKCRLPEFLQG